MTLKAFIEPDSLQWPPVKEIFSCSREVHAVMEGCIMVCTNYFHDKFICTNFKIQFSFLGYHTFLIHVEVKWGEVVKDHLSKN